MAGGIFTSQNKVRPGAYINFKSVPKPTSKVGERGIVTLPLRLGWGATGKVIEILSSDITNNKLINKIGYYGYETNVLAIREALKNSYKLLVYRLDKGGNKATATLENLIVTAKYPGEVGNRITITIKELKTKKFEVRTLLDNKVMDVQIVELVDNLTSNDFVDFSGTGELISNIGEHLSGGDNGSKTNDVYVEYFNTIKTKKWNAMGIFTDDESIKSNTVELIKELRETKGRKVQAVINDYAANYEGIISVDQGYITKDEEVGVADFVAYVTGLTGGSLLNKSNTYKIIDGAVEIINPKTDEEIESGIIEGKFMLSYSQDESVVIEVDINSLKEFTIDKNKAFCKNRVVRTLDDVNNTVKGIFEKTYLGKVNNNDEGRKSFKADISSYFKELYKIGAIKEFDIDDIIINMGAEIDSVEVNCAVQPIDAMEKLYMTVLVG